MSRERAKILKMVADGNITPEEGEKLLDRLQPSGATATATGSGEGDEAGRPGPIKYLRVVVDDGDKVNIRVPIALIRTGIKLTTLVPRSASEQLSEYGIDLSRLNGLEGQQLMDELRELSIDIDGSKGETIRVFCE